MELGKFRSVQISLVVFLFLSSPLWATTPEEWTKASSVKVTQSGGQNGVEGLGAGTVIGVDPNGFDVITCAHVVLVWGRTPVQINGQTWEAPVGKTCVQPVGEQKLAADVVAYHRDCDLALLRVKQKNPKVKSVPIAVKESYDGTAVVKCGYPGKGTRHVQGSKGMRTRRGRWSFGTREWETAITSVSSHGGDSGGGLFREHDQQLVGVVWGAGEFEGTWRLCAVPIWEVRTFLTGAEWKGLKGDKK